MGNLVGPTWNRRMNQIWTHGVLHMARVVHNPQRHVYPARAKKYFAPAFSLHVSQSTAMSPVVSPFSCIIISLQSSMLFNLPLNTREAGRQKCTNLITGSEVTIFDWPANSLCPTVRIRLEQVVEKVGSVPGWRLPGPTKVVCLQENVILSSRGMFQTMHMKPVLISKLHDFMTRFA